MLRVEENGRLTHQQLDNMATADLQALLRADLAAPEGEQLDIEDIQYISAILADRQPAYKDVAQAQAEFYADYYPLLDDDRALYDFSDEPERKPLRFPFRCWRKMASAVAVLVLLVFAGFGTAYALGFLPFASVAKWDDEQFWFECVSENEKPLIDIPDDGAFELPDDVEIGPFIPHWLPEGFAFEKLHASTWGYDLNVDMEYWRHTPERSDLLWVSYTYMTVDIKIMYEKDDTEMVVYRVNDIDHYIMSNLSRETIAWRKGNVEYSISGPFSLEEAKKIIDSIYWEED